MLTATRKHFQNATKHQIPLLVLHDVYGFVKTETHQNADPYRIPDTDFVFSKMQKNHFALLSEEIDKKFCVFSSICIRDLSKKIQNEDGSFVADFWGRGQIPCQITEIKRVGENF